MSRVHAPPRMQSAALIVALGLSACATSGPPETPAPAEPEPQAAAPEAAAPTPDLTRPPELGPPPELTLPPVVRRELPNGLQLLVVEHHELPLADLLLVVRTGSEADPATLPGLASLTGDLIDEGTANRSALEIADQEAFLGVDLRTGSGWDESTVSLHTPTARLDSALALFADVVLHPAFPEEEMERLRQERLTELLQLRDRGPAIADRVFNRLVYGTAHPYGRPPRGTEASVREMSRADVQRFYRTWYRPNNATLMVVGDVTPDDVERRVREAFGDWPAGTLPAATLPSAPAAAATTIYLVDKPGAAQSSFRIGAVGVPRSTDDYFALAVMNTILGGSFTSRLNQNLRETNGYTYGARSGFSMRQGAGPFLASAEIVAAKTDSALVEFMKELRAIRDTVPKPELEKAKRYLQLQLPGRFETTGQIAGQLVPLVLYHLPLDYYDAYVQDISAVTQQDVRRVARRYVQPDSLAVIIVGDRASVLPGLEALNVGPVRAASLEGGMPQR